MTEVNEWPVGGRIVVGVDGSDGSKDALRWAARQAEMTGARLEVVATWAMPPMAYGWDMPAPVDVDFADGPRQVLADTLREVVSESSKVTISTVVVQGPPAPTLLDAAAGADLLVVGSRGHGEFSGMLLGSVSQHCVTHAGCPVVVVRHHPPAAGSEPRP